MMARNLGITSIVATENKTILHELGKLIEINVSKIQYFIVNTLTLLRWKFFSNS